jgi:type IV secretion system protein VirD4
MTRFMSSASLRQPDKLPEPGLLVGWSLESRPSRRPIGFTYGNPLKVPATGYLEPILLSGEGHLMTIAPTGAGKGTGCIIPALLRYPGPVIVVDPKGENATITARRRREMGQRVVVIDPIGITDMPSDSLNPMDAIDIGLASAVDEVAVLAQALCDTSQDDRNRYWSNRGMHLAIGAMLQVLVDAQPPGGNLLQVRDLINTAAADPGLFAKKLMDSPHPEVQRIARMLSIGAPETLGGIVSFSQEMVDFLRGDRIQACIARTSFNLDDITKGAPLSIYLVLPPHMLESHSRLLRLWLGALISCITRRRARPKQSTLFILDEAAQLGELPHLRQAITLLRGYGLQTWSFWQDASQLQMLYPRDWKTMVNNCRVLQCFGALNQVAADGMAEMTGFSSGEAMLDLGPDEMLLQLAGDEAVVAKLPNYLADPAFKDQFDRNPYHDASRAVMPRKAAPQRMYARSRDESEVPPVVSGMINKADPLLGKLLDKARKSK